MIFDVQRLNPKLFKLDQERLPTRKGFGEGLLEAGREDKRIVGLCADLTESTQMHLFKKEFPERFIEMGVGEQNLAAVASGLAALGKIPFLSSYAMFSPGRNWEQIRTTICYNDRNVKVVGSHAGVSVGPDGGTHQAIEDLALMRVLPRMTVVVPCDALEAKKATLALAKFVGPAYLRLAREKTPVITTEASPFLLGKANILWHGDQPRAAIFSTGPIVSNALEAASELAQAGVSVSVTNVHTVKPLDQEAVVGLAREARAVVVVEEHQRKGGLGGAIAETLAEHAPTPIEFVGIDDQFGQSGTPEELIKHYGLGVGSIKAAVERAIARSKI